MKKTLAMLGFVVSSGLVFAENVSFNGNLSASFNGINLNEQINADIGNNELGNLGVNLSKLTDIQYLQDMTDQEDHDLNSLIDLNEFEGYNDVQQDFGLNISDLNTLLDMKDQENPDLNSLIDLNKFEGYNDVQQDIGLNISDLNTLLDMKDQENPDLNSLIDLNKFEGYNDVQQDIGLNISDLNTLLDMKDQENPDLNSLIDLNKFEGYNDVQQDLQQDLGISLPSLGDLQKINKDEELKKSWKNDFLKNFNFGSIFGNSFWGGLTTSLFGFIK